MIKQRESNGLFGLETMTNEGYIIPILDLIKLTAAGVALAGEGIVAGSVK